MPRRLTSTGSLAPLAVAVAGGLGLLATIDPLVALAGSLALVFAYLVFNDLAVGFAVLAFLSFLDTLPTSGGLSIAKGAGLLLAVAWLARFALAGREGPGYRDFFSEHAGITWALGTFLAWSAVSLLWATSSHDATEALSRYALNMLLLPIAYAAVRSRRDVALVLAAIVAGAVLAAAFGILAPPNPSVIEESSRATGTVGDPNELAAFVLVGLAVAVGFALGRKRSPAVRIAAAAAVPICLAGIFLSLSRGGLVALAALLVAGTVFAGRWRIAMALVLVAVVAGGALYFGAFASPPARERVTHVEGGSGRSDLWTIAGRMVKDHPLTGVGVGNFQAVSSHYVLQPGRIARADLIFSNAPKVTHNTYLEILTETGIPGLALFMVLVLSCLRSALRAAQLWSTRDERTMEALARCVFLGLVGMLVADFFISDMYTKLLWVMFALCPALLAVARSEATRPVSLPAA